MLEKISYFVDKNEETLCKIQKTNYIMEQTKKSMHNIKPKFLINKQKENYLT